MHCQPKFSQAVKVRNCIRIVAILCRWGKKVGFIKDASPMVALVLWQKMSYNLACFKNTRALQKLRDRARH